MIPCSTMKPFATELISDTDTNVSIGVTLFGQLAKYLAIFLFMAIFKSNVISKVHMNMFMYTQSRPCIHIRFHACLFVV